MDIYLRQNSLLLLCETYILIALVYIDINDAVNAGKALNAGEQFVGQINASRITEEFKRLRLVISEMKK
ncbi:MAG: hypothetical protein J0M18_07360 [Ignavibacteria bacterium]|nr:hypothetical protein [Ignavibacteria bacterium]